MIAGSDKATCLKIFDTLSLALGTIDHSIIVFGEGPIYKSTGTLSNERTNPGSTHSPAHDIPLGAYLQDFSLAIAPPY
jgi:hypothetical protein